MEREVSVKTDGKGQSKGAREEDEGRQSRFHNLG